MRYLFCCLALVLLPLQTALSAGPDADVIPTGLWLTAKKDTVVRIEQCGETLCGYIVWVHPDEDQTTPDGEPLCAQKVLWGFNRSPSDRRLWKDGNVYRADKDKKYSGRIRVLSDDKIRVRGFIGLPFLGKSYELTRVQASDYPLCNGSESVMTEVTED